MNYILQFLMAMAATISFAVLFSAPKRELLLCGISGALGWIFYYVITQMHFGPVPACLIATLILTVFSRIMAVVRKNPATVYLLAGIFPLVPGAGIYYTAYYLITNERELFSSKGLETLEIAFAITFGIIFGFAVPQTLLYRLFGDRGKKASCKNKENP